MSSRKLSDSDKQDILELYRQPGETTLTLASRYGVSSSTISRILKSSLSGEEYENLLQEKRAGRVQSNSRVTAHKPKAEETPEQPSSATIETNSATVEKSSGESTGRRKRSRSSVAPSEEKVAEEKVVEKKVASASHTQLELLDISEYEGDSKEDPLEQGYKAEASTLHEMLGEDLLDEEIDEDDDEEDREYEEDEDEDDEFEDDLELGSPPIPRNTAVKVLPLSQAELPNPCYLVVDRGAELITRPLGDFGDLGRIPSVEQKQKTLPIFENHRVARRFSSRNQRVIKVPDGGLFLKVAFYLEAKGITRLLVDGQVYSIEY